MNAKPKPANPYADEDGVFLSEALWDDLNSDAPSADAVAWARRQHDLAMADPRPPLTSDQVWANLLARHETRLKRARD